MDRARIDADSNSVSSSGFTEVDQDGPRWLKKNLRLFLNELGFSIYWPQMTSYQWSHTSFVHSFQNVLFVLWYLRVLSRYVSELLIPLWADFRIHYNKTVLTFHLLRPLKFSFINMNSEVVLNWVVFDTRASVERKTAPGMCVINSIS